ncbi:MAG TPA: XRE family transcriptional regulator [Candidatus Latescibacteria bacterium]|nr:XRE family transcriptional regulator [Candidatus Latescibacterota bacterium]
MTSEISKHTNSALVTAPIVYSKRIGSRLAQAIGIRGWTQSKLAKELGITNNTLSRMLSGQDRLNMNLCCDAMDLLGFSPEMLLSGDPIVDNWTGISAVDHMFLDIYGERTPSGIEEMGRYVSRDYLCCSPHYSNKTNHVIEWFKRADEKRRAEVKSVYDLAHHGRDLLGITYSLELELNSAVPDSSAVRTIDFAVLIGENQIFLHSEFMRTYVETGAVVIQCMTYETYYLTKSFAEIAKGARVQIARRVWFGSDSAVQHLNYRPSFA